MPVDEKMAIFGAPYLRNDMTGRRYLGVVKIGKHGRRAKHLLVVQAEYPLLISTVVLVMGVAGFTSVDLLREVVRLERWEFIENNIVPANSPCFGLECGARCVLEGKFQTHCNVIKRRAIAAFNNDLVSGGNGTIATAEVAAQTTSPQNVQAVSDSGTGYYFTLVIMVHLSEGKFNAKRKVDKYTNVTQITIVVNMHIGD